MYKCSMFRDEPFLFKRMTKEIGIASVSTISQKRQYHYKQFLSYEAKDPSFMRTHALVYSLQYTDFSRSDVPSLFLWGAEENKIAITGDLGVIGVWYREKKAFTKTSSKDVFLYESEGSLTKRIRRIASIERL